MEFEIKNGVLKEYRGKEGAVVIPEGVTRIENDAFSCCFSIVSVTVPEGVTSIGEGAFYGCDRLKSVILPRSVTSIGESAFSSYSNLKVRFRGLTFSPDTTEEGITINSIIDMMLEKDYDADIPLPVKFAVIWDAFCDNPKDVETYAYIKKNFVVMFHFLIDNEDTATIQKVLDNSRFITKRNIDKNILYAIDNRRHQSQVILMNHKTLKNWYEDAETLIKKKFAL